MDMRQSWKEPGHFSGIKNILEEYVQILNKIQKEEPRAKQSTIQRSQRLRVKVSPRNRSSPEYLPKSCLSSNRTLK